MSVVVLTHNEARTLPGCLDSLAGFADIHVVDSGSTDGTRELAAARGVGVHVNAPFVGFGTQRNWAIDHVPAKYDWHLHLDADERVTPALAAELAAVAAAAPPHGGYQVPSKLLFAGRWLRHAGQYPGYQVRFFHRRRLRFADHGHGQREVTADPVGYLREPLLHHGFAHGIDHWLAKHQRYARREAEQIVAGGAGGRLFSRDPVERRRGLKRVAGRLPARYLLRLVYLLVARQAVRDGWPGVTYAHMLATYEGMTDVYLRLLRRGVDLDAGL